MCCAACSPVHKKISLYVNYSMTIIVQHTYINEAGIDVL